MRRVRPQNLQGGEVLLRPPTPGRWRVLAWLPSRRLPHYWIIICDVRDEDKRRVDRVAIPIVGVLLVKDKA